MLWLNELTEKITCYKVNLQVIEKSDDPQAILCGAQESDVKILYCFNSPKEIERFRKARKNKLNLISTNVFSHIPSRYNIYEATILNTSLLFDKELMVAWKALTGHPPYNVQKLWILVFDNNH
jgi:hypothetical protein